MNKIIDKLIGFWFRPTDSWSYAALRIGYALSTLDQWQSIWRHRLDFFGEMASIGINGTKMYSGAIPSIFTLAQSPNAITASCIAALIAAILLICGIANRICAIALFYWHYSLAFDLFPAISGYDMIIKVMGFILMVSPLGNEWNIQRVIGAKKSRTASHSKVPVYGLYLLRWQLFVIYLVTVWLKTPDQYWRNGQFLSYFMMSLYSKTPLPVFAHMEAISVVFSFGTLLVECSIPFLLCLRRWRFVGLLLGLGLHIGIGFTTNLQLFSLAILVMYPAFFDSKDLAFLREAFTKIKKPLAASRA